jgi:Cytochrome P450
VLSFLRDLKVHNFLYLQDSSFEVITDDPTKGWPFVGNAVELASSNSNSIIHIFRKWAQEHGPISQFSVMGAKQVVLSDEKIANELFVKRGNRYSDRGAPHAVEYISMNQNPGFRPKDGKLFTLLPAG